MSRQKNRGEHLGRSKGEGPQARGGHRAEKRRNREDARDCRLLEPHRPRRKHANEEARRETVEKELTEVDHALRAAETLQKEHQESILLLRNRLAGVALEADDLRNAHGAALAELCELRKQAEHFSAKLEKSGVDALEFRGADSKIEAIEIEKARLSERIEKMDPNLSAIPEYNQRDLVFREHFHLFGRATDARDGAPLQLLNAKKARFEMFIDGFYRIQKRL